MSGSAAVVHRVSRTVQSTYPAAVHCRRHESYVNVNLIARRRRTENEKREEAVRYSPTRGSELSHWIKFLVRVKVLPVQ